LNLLALETATDRCSVAVSAAGVVAARVDDRPRVHAGRVLGMVDECLTEVGLTVAGLDAIAFGRGPGSFTGVRIAAGVVQGLALGADRAVVPVSTLAAHAVAARRRHQAARVAVCVDARMRECYWGLYRVGTGEQVRTVAADALAVPADLALPEGADWFGVGTGWRSWPELAARLAPAAGLDADLLPEAVDLLGLAAEAVTAGTVVRAESALPVYLRDEVAWQGLPPGGQETV
jgi:tRNA threonylcarbamoyladenosine biosynthesis protein TsaB